MRGRTGILKPVIVAQLLVVMLLAGVGASFALNPHAVDHSGSFTITKYVEVYNTELTQITGITVTVHNRDDAPHSGTVKVAIEQAGNSVTGQGSITDLAGGDTIDITVNLEPMSIGNYQWRVIVTQTS